MELPSTNFDLSRANVSLRKFLVFFPKNTRSKNLFYIFSKNALLISGNEFFLYLWKGVLKALA